jgi:Bacterial PH domain/Short C-terminal domain
VARYADRLLADGEQVVLRARQHWLAPIITGRAAIAVFFASVLLIVLNTRLTDSPVRTALGYLALVLLVVSLIWIAMVLVSWYSEDYLVTNRRVLKVDGILRKRSADSSLEKINDAVLSQGIVARIFGYGDLDILTAADVSVDQYRMLAGAQQFKKTMLDEKHQLEEEFVRVPAPPLRAAPLAPAASPIPPPPAARGMSPDEITKSLGDLADLRDRGAISAEDYEAKKQDLLGRL